MKQKLSERLLEQAKIMKSVELEECKLFFNLAKDAEKLENEIIALKGLNDIITGDNDNLRDLLDIVKEQDSLNKLTIAEKRIQKAQDMINELKHTSAKPFKGDVEMAMIYCANWFENALNN